MTPLKPLIVLAVLVAGFSNLGAEEKLNVLWIVSDDLGLEVGCYGEKNVATPNLDRLAGEGARYTRAFATAPVCSSSRSAFITGIYQTTIGAQHHDTPAPMRKPLPEGVRTVTEIFREAGYHVSNRSASNGGKGKTHYNFDYEGDLYGSSDWADREEGQAFFAQVQIKEPHREFLRNEDPERPGKIELPPYYPDHPVTRADWANYLASVEEADRKTGEVLDRLETEGLAENTLVLFFGDHGRPHVRGKQWLYEGGIQIPLLVRWPGVIETGIVDDRMVSMIDFAPASLAAAGLAVPASMQGIDFLDEDFNGREFIYAARDRCGDAIDRIRCVRTERFKYIRNFMPEVPYTVHSGYKKASYPVVTLLEVLKAQERLTPAQALYMAKTRPEEELYDLEADPFEIHNLAEDPAHRETLAALRENLEKWIEDTDDQGRFPEGDEEYIRQLKDGKYQAYARKMKSRGLDPEVSDREYLNWWKKELGVE